MIKATELRVGNMVQDDEGTQFDMRIIEQAKEYPYNPIPNTPEILLAFGFEKCLSHHGDYQILMGKGTTSNGLFLIINLDDYTCVIGQLQHFSHSFGRYEYLHQLQNLYWSLSGTELKYNP